MPFEAVTRVHHLTIMVSSAARIQPVVAARRPDRLSRSPAHAADAGIGVGARRLAAQSVELIVVDTADWSAPLARVPLFGGQGTINVNSWSPDSSRFAFISNSPDDGNLSPH
jgi:hypothetical protein